MGWGGMAWGRYAAVSPESHSPNAKSILSSWPTQGCGAILSHLLLHTNALALCSIQGGRRGHCSRQNHNSQRCPTLTTGPEQYCRPGTALSWFHYCTLRAGGSWGQLASGGFGCDDSAGCHVVSQVPSGWLREGRGTQELKHTGLGRPQGN